MAVVALAWMAFMSVVLLFPTTPQTNAQEMNYSAVVFGGTIILATVYYYFPVYGGVHWFKGPTSTVARAEDVYGDVNFVDGIGKESHDGESVEK